MVSRQAMAIAFCHLNIEYALPDMMIFNAEIVCPKCHSAHLKFVSIPESREKDWCHFSCADCGYQLTFADVGRQAVAQSVEMMGGDEEN